jgi:prepilin-type N-terminal cleavage/methylation domain-containing protein
MTHTFGTSSPLIRSCASQTAQRGARGFTLLEIIVVTIVLAIIATLIVPRMTGNQQREFRATVDKVGDLLTMYGQRQNLGQKIVGIQHDARENALRLIELQDDGYGFASWRADPYVRAVQLPWFMSASDIDFYVDGEPYDCASWPLTSEPGQQRPMIEIYLRNEGEIASISLSPHGVSPIILNGANSSGISRRPIDLDAEGRAREQW